MFKINENCFYVEDKVKKPKLKRRRGQDNPLE